MSASLVGSEMCIRDRASPSTPSDPPGSRGSGSSAGAASACGPPVNCLLYTLTLPTICSV
eukprot:13584535-Alexandrium_andersonii.AAC.1